MSSKSKVLISLALGLAICSQQASAHHSPRITLAADGSRSMTVRFADLNLGTPAGVQVLHRRLRAAAETVCSQTASGTRWLPDDVKQCQKSAFATAVRSIGHKALPQPQIDILAFQGSTP